MKVSINSVHFKTDKKLEDFIQDKVGKLNTFYEGVIGGEVTLKLESHDKVKMKVAEIRLMVKGYDLFARKESQTFEEATDVAVEALRRQLRKHKEKMRNH